MEDETYLRMTMESGSVYTYEHGIVVIDPVEGSKYAIKAWQCFAFDENDPAAISIPELIDKAVRLDPAPGLRFFVYGKDEWRISTRIKEIE